MENVLLLSPANITASMLESKRKLYVNCFSNKEAISLLYLIISDILCPFWLLACFPWQVQSLHIKLKESYSIILVCPLSPFLCWELLVNTVPSGCNFLLHIF